MTREEHFRGTFLSQFVPYSGWQNIERSEIQKLPPSSFPAFSLELGKTICTKFDPAGKAISGEQDFTVTVYYTLALRNLVMAYLDHSDITTIVEQFLNAPLYAPPPVFPGDPYCIIRTMLTETKAPAITFGDTRFVVRVSGRYTFMMF